MDHISDGCDCGHNNIRTALSQDMFGTMIAGRIQRVSRWALNIIDPNLRNSANLIEADLRAQFEKIHGNATLRSGDQCITPSTDLIERDGAHKPIVAVRVFHGGAQQVVNNIAYYFHYGFMMCNLAQDVHLEEGVYAYIDIETALSKLDRSLPTDRTKCIGIIEGYLKYRHEDKVSLNPRSTKLIAVFPHGIRRFTCPSRSVRKMRWLSVYHPISWGHQ